MADHRISLKVGGRIISDAGIEVVIALTGHGYTVRGVSGQRDVRWVDLAAVRAIHNGRADAVLEALRPDWDRLLAAAQRVALNRLEIVQEILTGFRDGHPELARKGEPLHPFGDPGVSVSRRCERMAQLVSAQKAADPDLRDAKQARRAARQVAGTADTVQGEHKIPAVQPAAVRCDRGSIFLSDHFYGLLRDFGIDLLPSRGSKPTDNPHVERWHETLQRGLQQWPGYKGRSVSERGRVVGLRADEPLLTAAELQTYLRRFVCPGLPPHLAPGPGAAR